MAIISDYLISKIKFEVDDELKIKFFFYVFLLSLHRKKNCFRLINKFTDLNPIFIENPVIKKFTYLTKKSLANLSKE